ncbi:hypothetical protein PYCC9005_003666 [Savitreella phatthalungensis]
MLHLGVTADCITSLTVDMIRNELGVTHLGTALAIHTQIQRDFANLPSICRHNQSDLIITSLHAPTPLTPRDPRPSLNRALYTSLEHVSETASDDALAACMLQERDPPESSHSLSAPAQPNLNLRRSTAINLERTLASDALTTTLQKHETHTQAANLLEIDDPKDPFASIGQKFKDINWERNLAHWADEADTEISWHEDEQDKDTDGSSLISQYSISDDDASEAALPAQNPEMINKPERSQATSSVVPVRPPNKQPPPHPDTSAKPISICSSPVTAPPLSAQFSSSPSVGEPPTEARPKRLWFSQPPVRPIARTPSQPQSHTRYRVQTPRRVTPEHAALYRRLVPRDLTSRASPKSPTPSRVATAPSKLPYATPTKIKRFTPSVEEKVLQQLPDGRWSFVTPEVAADASPARKPPKRLATASAIAAVAEFCFGREKTARLPY